MKKLFAVAVCLSFMSSSSEAQRAHIYKIVPAESNLWVFVAKAGLFSAFAHDHHIGVKSFGGSISVPENGAASGALTLDIETKSLTVLDQKISDKDRAEIASAMHSAVLESEKYPKIAFKSVSVSGLKQTGEHGYSFTVNGDLTLHGTSKRIAVPVSATLAPQQLRATGQYTLRQTDFGIKPYSAAGGTIKVKNEVVINFNLVARP